MSGFYITLLLLAVAYAAFLTWCIVGWYRLKEFMPENKGNLQWPSVSVVIPVRDEEESIVDCLRDFISMDYPPKRFEVIVVDDHSRDGTVERVEAFIGANPRLAVRLIRLSDGNASIMYKKHSITEAVKTAGGEFIVTTDADCRRKSAWLRTLAQAYLENHPEMISAPVLYSGEKNIFGRIQSLEFLGLVAIGASSIANAKPVLCNGANLAFTKRAFIETGGYHASRNLVSGDDTQLLEKISQWRRGAIRFVKSREAVVTTRPQSSVSGLVSQRQRWASKIPRQMPFFTVSIAGIAFLLHSCLLFAGFLTIIGIPVEVFWIPLLIKAVPEFILLSATASFFNKRKLLFLFLPAQVLYPFYISIIGLLSLTGNYTWKGRKIQ